MKLPLSRRPDPAVLLVALLVVVNLLAVLGMVRARRDARAALREGLALETRADARAFEARLASEHAQLEFLAHSTPLAAPSGAGDDPVARRWERLDLEATLLLYLQSSPAVVRLRVREGEKSRAVVRRIDGVPALAAPGETLPLDHGLLRTSWVLDEGPPRRELEAWVDPRPLVADLGDHLLFHRSPPSETSGPVERVTSPRWTPRLEGWLERTEGDARALGAVERLADLYRVTLLLNVVLLPATLLLGALTLRRMRRLTRLESERRQRERLRQLELQVQHSERLASLGRFAAGMAHEINNPLAGMSNYLQLLREDLDGGEPEAARQWLPRIEEGIERVAGTVQQVLHFAEPGRAEHRWVKLEEVLERTADFLRGHPDCRGATLRVRCPPDLDVVGDTVSLGQLVLNLVLNACQAHPGGEVEIVAEARKEAGEEWVELRVLDRGPGIDPEIRDRLFEPFQSTRGSSGLGLAVCHGIVSRHGGHIEATDREPGPGTQMWVRLPLRAAPEETA
jgi:signal transduction histidine kinase